MKHSPSSHEDAGEQDTVWKLLDHSTAATPSARFVDDTVRAARLAGQPSPWWHKLMAPAPITGFTAAAAAIALAFTLLQAPPTAPSPTMGHNENAAQIEEIADIAETETLIAAVEHMDRFSDTELVCLIGF